MGVAQSDTLKTLQNGNGNQKKRKKRNEEGSEEGERRRMQINKQTGIKDKAQSNHKRRLETELFGVVSLIAAAMRCGSHDVGPPSPPRGRCVAGGPAVAAASRV